MATQDEYNVKAIAQSILPASEGMTYTAVLNEIGMYKDSGGTNTLPAGWSAAAVDDAEGNTVLANTVFTVAAAGDLPDANDPLNISGTIAFDPSTFADLATLAADGSQGDGFYAGGDFTSGQYIILGDDSLAHYASAAWAAGAAA